MAGGRRGAQAIGAQGREVFLYGPPDTAKDFNEALMSLAVSGALRVKLGVKASNRPVVRDRPVRKMGEFVAKRVVPKVRVELTRPLGQWFLRPSRLPFRHFGTVPPL